MTSTFRLARNEVLALKRARGTRIRVLAGCIASGDGRTDIALTGAALPG
jgi:hypothetical protein